jgi:hypothetical protein
VAEEVGRRGFLKGAGALGLFALADPMRLGRALAAAPPAGAPGRFLDAHELDTLRAVVNRLIPGPPDDPSPGALEAGCAEAIDLLLGAFAVDPPLIHAGGPFSDRNGSATDDFASFVPLDAHAELGWRIRLEGSKGLPEREFAGPVVGLQQVYRDGLAHLDVRAREFALARPGDFATALAPVQILILSDLTDGAVQSFVGAAMANTIEAMYGPPEYGGNRGLAGWAYTGWPGDTQPRGFTAAEVSGKPPVTRSLRLAEARAIERFLPGLLRGRR